LVNITPIGDRVLVKHNKPEEKTKSGIVLPSNSKEKPQEAEVVAVGEGGLVDGKEVKMQVKVGDFIIYSKYSGTEVKFEEQEYVIVKQEDILAVVNKK
jgi:chaperonin GroES